MNSRRYPLPMGDKAPTEDWVDPDVFARKSRLVQWLYFKLTGWRVVPAARPVRGAWRWTDRKPGHVRPRERP